MTLSELKDIIDPFNPIRIFYGNTFKDAQLPCTDSRFDDKEVVAVRVLNGRLWIFLKGGK